MVNLNNGLESAMLNIVRTALDEEVWSSRAAALSKTGMHGIVQTKAVGNTIVQ